ncbi:MAG: universal stress protein [Propionibacteriaceae bacterium]
MTTLIGLSFAEHSTSALQLGSMLARSADDDVVVGTVVPEPWPPNPYQADTEFLGYQEAAAASTLAYAQTQVGADLRVDYRLHTARSVSSGLQELAQQTGATSVVLGSSASGAFDRVALGGVAERLLHSTGVPVSVAPHGFRAPERGRVGRITVAFGRSDHDSDLLESAAFIAGSIAADLRVACFAVRPMAVYTGGVEESAEDLVVERWVAGLGEKIAASLRAASTSIAVDTRVQTVVGQGVTWAEALSDVSWVAGDVLAIGTSTSLSRFFLGSHASKIVRNSPVPVTLLPRTSVGRQQ